MPKLTKPIYAVRPGGVYPEWIEKGEEVDGRLEEIARAMKSLPALPEGKAIKAAPENK